MKKQILGLCLIALSGYVNAMAENTPMQTTYKCEGGYVWTYTSDNYETFTQETLTVGSDVIASESFKGDGVKRVDKLDGGVIYEHMALGNTPYPVYRLFEGYGDHPVLDVMHYENNREVHNHFQCEDLSE